MLLMSLHQRYINVTRLSGLWPSTHLPYHMVEERLAGTTLTRLLPVPETKTAILPNSADGRPTRHRYVRTEPSTFVMDLSPVKGNYRVALCHKFIFRCDVTGAERVWGVEK